MAHGLRRGLLPILEGMNDLPPLLKDFIRAIAPDPAKGPLDDLRSRYEERHQEQMRILNGTNPIGYPKGSPEYNVEIRIRDWVRRMEAEKAEMERIRKGNSDAPPQIDPPRPPKPPAP